MNFQQHNELPKRQNRAVFLANKDTIVGYALAGLGNVKRSSQHLLSICVEQNDHNKPLVFYTSKGHGQGQKPSPDCAGSISSLIRPAKKDSKILASFVTANKRNSGTGPAWLCARCEITNSSSDTSQLDRCKTAESGFVVARTTRKGRFCLSSMV
jgi:hypothetical protein